MRRQKITNRILSSRSEAGATIGLEANTAHVARLMVHRAATPKARHTVQLRSYMEVKAPAQPTGRQSHKKHTQPRIRYQSMCHFTTQAELSNSHGPKSGQICSEAYKHRLTTGGIDNTSPSSFYELQLSQDEVCVVTNRLYETVLYSQIIANTNSVTIT